ncbi:MAG: type I 3-dehydroquinate dehydratase [Planctomycetota bacterium]|nr:MAG: type I 3-dehydroquinate dehydratase [Planctomycetota bacterium]
MSLALSLHVAGAEQAVAAARQALGLARWLELRLDRAPALDFAALVRALPLPVIAACPRREEGGDFAGSLAERDARLCAAAQGGARFVDVPLGAPRPAALPAATGVIHSFHERPGERSDLRAQLHRIEARLEPGDVAKLVAHGGHEDGMRALDLYGTTRAPLVAFAQGPGARASRAWAPVFGAPWTYASLPGAATAPGQWTLQELFALWPPGGPDAATSLYAVVGRPIAHSRSPLLWNTAFRLCGLNAFHLAVEVESFDRFLRQHRARPFQGFSITAPFKGDALRAADAADAAAAEIGAANTLQRTAGGWKAWNTDGPAALDALAAAGLAARARILVLGAGGAARAVLHEARRRGHPAHVAARRADAALDLAAQAGGASAGALDQLRLDGFAALVQATPVGGDALPGNLLAGRLLPPGLLVLDMVYSPARTPLLAQALEQGARPVFGYDMLVRQMRAQFHLLTGREVPAEPLLAAVRADLA